jgi:hypothetical protein
MHIVQGRTVKRARWILALLIVGALLLSGWGAVHAAPPTPLTPTSPPVPPQAPPLGLDIEAIPAAPVQVSGLPTLKAVLLVGPIDGDTGPWTTQEIEYMELAATELAAQGVTVHRFYTPNNDWEQIKSVSEGAHFLLYRGHGVYWSPMPNPTVGGFALKDRFVSPDEIRNGLRLAPNAIVMLYGCFATGSATNDEVAINSDEARRRVTEYAAPFVDIGVSGYYANWFGDAFQKLLRHLFQGKTLGQAYEAFYDYNAATVERYPFRSDPDRVMWLDKDNWWDDWQYNYAFVGQPDQTLQDLFGSPGMVVTPSGIVHLTDLDSSPQSFVVHVDSAGSAEFTWSASVTPRASWLDVQPLSGRSGQEISVVITASKQKPGTYETSIRIVADDPDIPNGDQTIPLTLRVGEEVHSTYLPTIRR